MKHPFIAALSTVALLAGCTTAPVATRVILLPQADGKASSVVVRSEDGEQTLSRPYQRAAVSTGSRGMPTIDQADPSRLRADHQALFEMMPADGR